MSKDTTITATEAIAEDICKDAIAMDDKQKVMHKHKLGAILYSVADTFKFVAAVTIPFAMMIAKDAGGGFTGALAAAAPYLGVAAGFTAIAIASHSAASHYSHSAGVDSQEMNAQHTAKYIVKELHEQVSCVTPPANKPEMHDLSRKDGKSWEQAVLAQRATQEMSRPQLG